MNKLATYRANMSFYLAQAQILRNEIEKQEDKLENHIKILDRYRKRKSGNQPTYLPDGLGRTGLQKSITESDSQVAGIWALSQNDEITPRWKLGDFYDPGSSSGTKIPILNRVYRAIEDNILIGCMTENTKSPLAQMVSNQQEGVQEFEIKTKKGKITFDSFSKTFEEKSAFLKAYSWLTPSIEDLVIHVPGRKDIIGDFDENTGLGAGGNWPEWSMRFIDDVCVISYNEWKKSKKKENLKQQLRKWSFEYAEGIRKAYPIIMDQTEKIEFMYDDLLSKDVELVIVSAVGDRSGIEGKSFRMRMGGHGPFNKPKRWIIHLDSKNKPRVKAEVEIFPEDYRRKNVRGIVVSQSLKTDSLDTAKWLKSLRIPTYVFTQNVNCEIIKEDEQRCTEIPKTFSYYLRKNPEYTIIPLVGLMTLDSFSSSIVAVSQTHKED